MRIKFILEKRILKRRSSSISAVLNFLRDEINKKILDKYIAVCHPTNPFLKNKSFVDAYNKINKIKNKKIESIVSYTQSPIHPFLFLINKKNLKFDIFKMKNKKYSTIERSQDRPKSYILSAAIKISKTDFF